MLIKVDSRDAQLYLKCCELIASDVEKYSSIKIVKELIPLGDVILVDNSEVSATNAVSATDTISAESATDTINETKNTEKIIIERKSLADLASSIRDGRYNEQSFRLNECSLHNHNIYYVIEGDLRTYKSFKGNVDKKALLSAIVSISYFKGFSVHRTITMDETAEWILQLAFKIDKERPNNNSFYSKNENENFLNKTPSAVYADVCNTTRIKKNNITPSNIGTIMLSQIPNVSNSSASAIMEKFGTFKELIKALSESETALNTITISTVNGKSRKISKSCISSIYDYLMPKNNSAL